MCGDGCVGWLALELGEFWGAYAATGEFVGPPNGVADSGEDGGDEEDAEGDDDAALCHGDEREDAEDDEHCGEYDAGGGDDAAGVGDGAGHGFFGAVGGGELFGADDEEDGVVDAEGDEEEEAVDGGV